MQQLFNLGGKNIVALDIGLSAVKVAEMECHPKSSKFVLLRYASVPLGEGAIIEDEIQKSSEIIEAIQKALQKADIKAVNCCVGLSGPNTVVKKLSLAGGTEDEIEDQVMWESEQYLPFNIEESCLDFDVVGQNEGGGIDVIVAAIKKDVFFNFKEIVEASGLKPKIVDLSILAVTNVFELIMKDKSDFSKSYLILDIGAQKTSFIICKNNMFGFAKEIHMGGLAITEEIQRRLGVNYYEAEDLKTNGDDKGNLPEEIVGIIDEVVELFFSEIKKTFEFYVSSTSDESLNSCLVTGGSCLVPGLFEGLEALLGVEVAILNPFEAIKYSERNFSKEDIEEITYRGANVLGLAMRTI